MNTDARIAERVAEQVADRKRRKAEAAEVRAELEQRRQYGLAARRRAKLNRPCPRCGVPAHRCQPSEAAA